MSGDRKDPPIVEQQFTYGLNVIDIGDVRVARGESRRPYSSCQHKRLRYDPRERRIWCADCERDIEGYDAFVVLAEQCHGYFASLNRRQEALAEAERFQARSRAVKALDEVWRSRSMVPACPTCGHGLLPEMFAGGVKSTLGRDYAEAKLKARKDKA